MSQTYNTVSNLAFMYKNEEHIKSGAVLDQNQINDRKSNLKNEQENAIQQVKTTILTL